MVTKLIAEKKMKGDSFNFRGVDFLEEFGIKCVDYDVLIPRRRPRKISIPKKHGQKDLGSLNWEERLIRIECDLIAKKYESPMTRAEMRELAYALAGKGKLYLWDEPDKYYIGEIYTPPEIFSFPKGVIRTFTIEFLCEPFAYREEVFFDLEEGINLIKYNGTEKAPCVIMLENMSETVAENITILAKTRRNE